MFPRDVSWRYAILFKTSYRYAERMRRRRDRSKNVYNSRFSDGKQAIYVVACRIISRFESDIFSDSTPYWLDVLAMTKRGEHRLYDVCWAEEVRVATDWKSALADVRELRELYPSSPYGRHAVIGDIDTQIHICASPEAVQQLEYDEGYSGCN